MVNQDLVWITKNSTVLNCVNAVDDLVCNCAKQRIFKPIFICGLARSGTTIVTELCNLHEHTGSYEYKDIPFLQAPYLWNIINNLYYAKKNQEQRPHGDAIQVTPNSPDAFEEYIWKQILPQHQHGEFCKYLTKDNSTTLAMNTLIHGIKKILKVRGNKTRYLSKGNYNIFRIELLQHLFPDAKFIICVRDPYQQAMSMSKVHQRFTDIGNKNPKFTKEMTILGHYEFGSSRKAITVNPSNAETTRTLWQHNQNATGYAWQWLDVYSFAINQYAKLPNILWFSHEALQKNPKTEIEHLYDFCELPTSAQLIPSACKKITPNTPYSVTAELHSIPKLQETYNAVLELTNH